MSAKPPTCAQHRTVCCVRVCDAPCVYTMYVRLGVTEAALVSMILKAKPVDWSLDSDEGPRESGHVIKKGAFQWQLATFSTKHRGAFSGHH